MSKENASWSNRSKKKPYSILDSCTTVPTMTLYNQQENHDLTTNVKRTLTKMKKRCKDIIEQHKLKVNRFGSLKDSHDIDMFVEKEQELHRQQSEFIIYCEHLESRLKKSESITQFRELAPIIEKEFAIECMRLRIGYPIYSQRLNIVKSVKNYQVTIILGETGSGKSTQLVQYFDGAGFSQHGLIACTQPRKIAALSVAKFVAKELGTVLGQNVGYRAGFKKIMSKNTRIVFMSDYEMFCEFQKDNCLAAYSCLLVDEVHERSIYTDLLLAMVKSCLSQRPEFRLVVMSATIDPGIFQSYFPHSNLIKVPGRSYPVNVIWEKTTGSLSNYVDAAIKKAIKVHENEEEGDVLVFLPTPRETELCSSKFAASLLDKDDYVCVSLHGRLDADDQQKVFEPPPEGKRKIVFATNCAETSITIPNIKYVIDTGFAKEIFFEVVSKIDTLAVRLISRSSADQRKGRAGRTSEGKCFRLYTEDDYKNMHISTKPEILRIHPTKAALKLFEMGADPLEFNFLEAPPISILAESIDYLNSIGAICNKKITPLGKQIAELPFEPQMNLFIINAIQEEMATEGVSIACLSSFSNNIFFQGRKEEEIESNRKKHSHFHDKYGDIISLLLVLQKYLDENKNQRKRWCFNNAINEKTLKSVCEKMDEVFNILKHKLQYPVNFPSKLIFNPGSIARVLFKSFECNTCIYLGHPRAGYLALNQEKYVNIHPSSCLSSLGLNPRLIVFQKLLCTSQDFACIVLSIQESWFEDLSPFLKKKITESEFQIVKVIYNRGMGEHFGRCFVGPKYSSLKQLENKIRQEVNDRSVFLDVSKGRSDLRVYSKENVSSKVIHLVEENIFRYVKELQEESKKIKIDLNNLAPKIIMHCGGDVKHMIMPNEFPTVIIKNVPDGTDSEMVRKKLETFGKIVNLKTFNSSNRNRWGCVTFETIKMSKECIESTSSDEEIVAVPCKSQMTHFSQCSAELTWTRRPLRGIGFIEFTNIEDFLTVSRNLYNKIWRVKIDKKRENQLFLPSVPKDSNAEEIKHHFTTSYNLLGDIRVNLPRRQVNNTPGEINQVKNKIDQQLKKYFDSYAITIKDIKPKDFYYKALIEFPSNQVIPSSDMYLLLGEELVRFTPKFSSQIILTPKLHEILQEEIKEEIQKIQTEKSYKLSFEMKTLRNGNFCLILNSNSAENLNWTKMYLNEIIAGDKIEVGINSTIRVLCSKEGRIFFEELEKKIPGSSVFLDYRHMTLILQGTELVRTQLKLEVDKYIDNILTQSKKTFNLNDSGRPRGLKRELIIRYGLDLEGLKTELNLIQIQLRRNTIEACGPEENLQKLDRLLYDLPGFTSSRTAEDEIDCVACFCPVELDSFYRIESCGHAYCFECLKQMLHLALKERMFPLECTEEECNMKMCWKDFGNFCKLAMLTQNNLVFSAFSHFITINSDKYRYCITPDCSTAYQITTTGEPYLCYRCGVTTCTTCHVDYHFGLTCTMYKSGKNTEDDVEKWKQEDPDNRRSCPNCQKLIMKDGGCQHISCSCGIHICWVCMETFVSSQACYGHLALKHGSFM